MKRRWTFPLALTFLTLIPWPGQPHATPEQLARALFWFPWVGLLLGAMTWVLGLALRLIFPSPTSAAFLVLFTVILTRGLHLDGLADTADGLAGGRTPEMRLRIMRDSRLGAFGALSLVLSLLLKFALMETLLQRGPEAGLLLAPLISRWGMVFLAVLSPYARPEGGLGQAMTEGATWPRTAAATLATSIFTFLAGGPPGLPLLGLAALMVLFLRLYFCRQLGGITGDVLGAANEILELLTLTGSVLLRPTPLIRWPLCFPGFLGS